MGSQIQDLWLQWSYIKTERAQTKGCEHEKNRNKKATKT